MKTQCTTKQVERIIDLYRKKTPSRDIANAVNMTITAVGSVIDKYNWLKKRWRWNVPREKERGG